MRPVGVLRLVGHGGHGGREERVESWPDLHQQPHCGADLGRQGQEGGRCKKARGQAWEAWPSQARRNGCREARGSQGFKPFGDGSSQRQAGEPGCLNQGRLRVSRQSGYSGCADSGPLFFCPHPLSGHGGYRL